MWHQMTVITLMCVMKRTSNHQTVLNWGSGAVKASGQVLKTSQTASFSSEPNSSGDDYTYSAAEWT